MKHIARILLATALLFTLPCCSSTGGNDNAKVAAIVDLALAYAEASGHIKPADAALVREAGKIILAPDPTPVAVAEAPLVSATATK